MRNILHGQRYYFFLIHSKKTSNRPYVQFLSSLVEKERRVNSPIPGRPHRRPAWPQSLPPATHTRATGWRPAGSRIVHTLLPKILRPGGSQLDGDR